MIVQVVSYGDTKSRLKFAVVAQSHRDQPIANKIYLYYFYGNIYLILLDIVDVYQQCIP
jgi:hypothetical protein